MAVAGIIAQTRRPQYLRVTWGLACARAPMVGKRTTSCITCTCYFFSAPKSLAAPPRLRAQLHSSIVVITLWPEI